MEELPSDRIVDQRIRNRIIEAMLSLAEGNDGVWRVGPNEYFESFYDWVSHSDDGDMRSNGALTDEELQLVKDVRTVLNEACNGTQSVMTADELIATGWPARVQAVARPALTAMLKRGRFREDMEEQIPTASDDWPWRDGS